MRGVMLPLLLLASLTQARDVDLNQDSPDSARAVMPRSIPPSPDADTAVRHETRIRIPTRLIITQPHGGVSARFDTCSALAINVSVGLNMHLGYKVQLFYFDGADRVPLGGHATMSGGSLFGASTAIFYGIQEVAKRRGAIQLATDIVLFETDVPPQRAWPLQPGRWQDLWQGIAIGELTGTQ